MTTPKFVQTRRDQIKELEQQSLQYNDRIGKMRIAVEMRIQKLWQEFEEKRKPIITEFNKCEQKQYNLREQILKWGKSHKHEHEWKRRWYKQDHYIEGYINQCTICGEKTGFID